MRQSWAKVATATHQLGRKEARRSHWAVDKFHDRCHQDGVKPHGRILVLHQWHSINVTNDIAAQWCWMVLLLDLLAKRLTSTPHLLHSFLLPSLFIPYFIGPHDWPTKKGFCSLVFIYGQACTRMNDTLKRKHHWGRSVATYCSVVVPVGPVNRHTVSHISLYSNLTFLTFCNPNIQQQRNWR